jgi:lysophospholipase L1-like esterase
MRLILICLPLFIMSFVAAGESLVLETFDEATLRAGNEHLQITSVAGKHGNAQLLTFAKNAKSTFAMGRVRGQPQWDQAAGLSLWVKGDGSQQCGGLQFVWNDDYSIRYDVAFPIHTTEWTKITIPWHDFIPVTAAGKSIPLDPQGQRKPSQLNPLWVGKWWYWGDYAAHSYSIDDLQLVKEIANNNLPPLPVGDPLARVRAKLKAGQAITVVTMGDSLTDTHHWTNRKTNWPLYFVNAVKERWQSTTTLVNPAIGGTELQQNIVLMPRWLTTTPQPDLVTTCFGFNDFSSGVRGESFQIALVNAIRRIRQATNNQAEVLIITTVPSIPKANELGEMAEAGRQAANAENAGLADAYLAFQTAANNGGSERLFADDKVHVSPIGQQLLAETVMQALSPK